MEIVIFMTLIIAISAAPPYQSASVLEDGSYQFFYQTGEDSGEQSRTEKRGADGVIVGKYSYTDPSGQKREVSYKAGDFGYVAKGDVSVPGAPRGQFPIDDVELKDDNQQSDIDSKKDTQEGKDSKTPDDEPSEDQARDSEVDEDYEEDDVQAMKLKQPDQNAPPDGFPLGFFGDFPGMRRLPEPVREDEEEDKSNEDGQEDVNENTTENGDGSTVKKPPVTRTFADVPAIFPFSNFEPHSWPASLPHISNFHQPVYVYSYHLPEAHGYYYFY